MINIRTSFWFSTAGLLLLLFIFLSCDVTDQAHNGTGQITVHLTDAPGDYEAVFIDIQKVRIKSNDYESTENDKEGTDGWITVNDEPVRLDLLQLRNGNTIQLGSEELDAGMYHQIRLVLGTDNEVVVNGTSHPLTTPSAQQSGLKLNINAAIEEGDIYNLLIDFDAGRSIVETGNGTFILKPVLRAAALQETGSIRGMVAPSNFQTSIMATANGNTISTVTNEDGTFAIIGVNEGTYDVTFTPNSEIYTDTTATSIAVENETDTELGTIDLPER